MSDFIYKTFKWQYVDYSGRSLQWYWELSIPRSLYELFVNYPHEIRTESDYLRFITREEDESFFAGFARKLKHEADKNGYSRIETAEWVLNLVASIPYAKDPGGEYPRYPIETLWDSSGDCDDSAILLAKLWRAMGFDVSLIFLPQHLAVGIHIIDPLFPGGYYFTVGPKNYYYAEAAGSYFEPGQRRIGNVSQRYYNVPAIVIPVPPLSSPSSLPTAHRKPSSQRLPVPSPSLPEPDDSEPKPAPDHPPAPVHVDEDGGCGCVFFLLVILFVLLGLWKGYPHLKAALSDHSLPRKNQTPTPIKIVTSFPVIQISPEKQAVINTGRLHIRSGPGVSYPVITSLANGVQVEVVGESSDGRWSLIDFPRNGWVRNKYLRFITPSSSASQPTGAENYRVTAPRGLNIRSGPGVEYQDIGDLALNQKIIVDKFNPDHTWAHIISPKDGWVFTKYISPNSHSVSNERHRLCIHGQVDRFERQPSVLNEIWGRIFDVNGNPLRHTGVEIYVPGYEDRFLVSVPVQPDGSFYLSALTPTNEYGVRLVRVPYHTDPVTFWFPDKAPYQKAIIIFRAEQCP